MVHFLSKDLDAFKASLEKAATLEIERTRFELQRAALEHEVRFRQLHEKRSLVVTDLYSRLVTAVDQLEYFFQPIEWFDQPSRDEKFQQAAPALVDLRQYFESHRLLFPEELAAQLHAFIEKLGTWMQDYHIWNTMPGSDVAKDRKHESIMTAWKGLKNEVPALRIALEVEFRKLLEV